MDTVAALIEYANKERLIGDYAWAEEWVDRLTRLSALVQTSQVASVRDLCQDLTPEECHTLATLLRLALV